MQFINWIYKPNNLVWKYLFDLIAQTVDEPCDVQVAVRNQRGYLVDDNVRYVEFLLVGRGFDRFCIHDILQVVGWVGLGWESDFIQVILVYFDYLAADFVHIFDVYLLRVGHVWKTWNDVIFIWYTPIFLCLQPAESVQYIIWFFTLFTVVELAFQIGYIFLSFYIYFY